MDPRIQRVLRRKRNNEDWADGTFRRRKSDLRKFEEWASDETGTDITEVGPFEIEDYLHTLRDDGYAPPTISGHYHSLKILYDGFESMGEIAENPMDDVEFKPRNHTKRSEELHEDIPYITPDEKELLCENVPNPQLRNELIIRMLWQTGLRKHELAGIRLDDMDRDERSIHIRSQKTGDNRTVFYQPSLDVLLDQWIDGGYRDANATASDSPYLFLTNRSEQMRWNRITEMVRDAAFEAGIQEVTYEDNAGKSRHRITAHTLRHSFAVQCLKNGMDIRTLQELMGHESLETTKKYLQLSNDDIKKRVQQFGAGSED